MGALLVPEVALAALCAVLLWFCLALAENVRRLEGEVRWQQKAISVLSHNQGPPSEKTRPLPSRSITGGLR